jgi:hypothetical protein
MKKVTEAELLEIQKMRESLLEIVVSIGELTLNKFLIQTQLDSISTDINAQQSAFMDFKEKERVLFEKLQQTYGTGNIDMETGEVSE